MTDKQLIELYWDAMESQDGKTIEYYKEQIRKLILEA